MAGQDLDNQGRGRHWWRWLRKHRTEDGDAGAVGQKDDEAGAYGPAVGPMSAGGGGGFIPIFLGFAALALVLGSQLGGFRWIAEHFGAAAAGAPDPKAAAMTEAEVAVARALHGAASVAFDDVRGVAAHEACGVVEDRGHDGGASRMRFIYQAGPVRLDDGSDAFARAWAKDCEPAGAVSAATVAGPPGRAGRHHGPQ